MQASTIIHCLAICCLMYQSVLAAEGTPSLIPHWAFTAPKAAPGIATVDGLLEVERKKHGLRVQGKAEPAIWLRRVYLDLIGLPPSLPQVKAFESDDSAAARAKLVDDLLGSPQYGERWGRHFMDIWRYSDWYGLGDQLRYSQKHLWHWRDWIVESLNADKPYDQMVREMLAGDEIAPDSPEVLRATGFLARNYYLFNRTTWLDDVVEHTAKAFLGITMNCVKCHEHKYDPLKHEDYYAFRAIFEPYHVRLDRVVGQPDLEKDGLPRAYDLHLERATYLHIKGDEKQPDKTKSILPAVPKALEFAPLAVRPVVLPDGNDKRLVMDSVADAQRVSLVAEQALQNQQDSGILWHSARVARLRVHALQSSRRGEASAGIAALALRQAEAEKALRVGESKDAKLAAALRSANEAFAKGVGEPLRILTTLKALDGPDEKDATRYLPVPKTSTGRRLALANWITDHRNPLTARVVVNQVWLRHFGQPLVEKVFDFGKQSKAPALQPLLDYLAVDFMNHGWSLKRLHRQLVLSQTYSLTSSNAQTPSSNLRTDPGNVFYWRMHPVRLDSHTLRDCLLSLSGKLDATLGGPTLPVGLEDSVPRRSLYFNHTRDETAKLLEVFDGPNVLDCYRRSDSIVPQQALALMNAATSLKSANGISSRLAALEDADFINQAFVLLMGTLPSNDELALCRESLQEIGGRPALVHTLLNHQDFVTVR